jgi:hypothetical protein
MKSFNINEVDMSFFKGKISKEMVNTIIQCVNNIIENFNKQNFEITYNKNKLFILKKQIRILIETNIKSYNMGALTYPILLTNIGNNVNNMLYEYEAYINKLKNHDDIEPTHNNNNIKSYIINFFLGIVLIFLFIKREFILTNIQRIYKKQNTITQITIIIICVLIILYLIVYLYFTKYLYSGSYNLINEPLNINYEEYIASYDDLSKMKRGNISNNSYGLSFWFYILPSSEKNYNIYNAIFSYGNNPIITYNQISNDIKVLINDEMQINNSNDELKETFSTGNVNLQKWNNIVINLHSSTMDIYLNGELRKSHKNITPKKSYNSMYSGSKNGIHGQICNLKYYNSPLHPTKIYKTYHILKHITPPVLL